MEWSSNFNVINDDSNTLEQAARVLNY